MSSSLGILRFPKTREYDPCTKTMASVHTAQGINRDELEQKLLASEGPKTQGTKADFVKFHDDKVRP